MRYRFMRFPEGKGKAVTFSYDDGSKHDVRLAEIFNKHNLKCTFNLNGEELRRDWDYCMTTEEAKAILDAGHEIAIHGLEHRAPGTIRAIEGIKEVLDCRRELEKRYGRIIRGMAYPDGGISGFCNGATREDVYAYLRALDIAYARSLDEGNFNISLPEDWYDWHPTAHHASDKMESYINAFLSIDRSPKGHPTSDAVPLVFYVWGHSAEFSYDDSWERIEYICGRLAGEKDIWYATNMEIYEYTKAYEALVWNAEGDMVYNPTLVDIWFDFDGKLFTVKSGQTLTLS